MNGESCATRGWVGIEARLSFSVRKRAGCYIASCPELGLKDQGETPNEAFDNLVDMILALISDAIGSDELEDVLEDCGFVKRTVGNQQEFSREREGGELPLSFKATAERGRVIRAAKLAWVG
jgi:predicted RNase H-like HicB family nuclease